MKRAAMIAIEPASLVIVVQRTETIKPAGADIPKTEYIKRTTQPTNRPVV